MTIKRTMGQIEKLYNAMDIEKRGEESNETTIAVIKERSGDNYDKLLDITFKVSEETSLGMNSVYMFVYEALSHMNESGATTLEELEENILDIEPDIYTGELTAWLAENVYHVSYLDQAISEYDPKEGIQLLSVAQQLAKQEVAQIVLREVQK